jgi:hypothetical protein
MDAEYDFFIATVNILESNAFEIKNFRHGCNDEIDVFTKHTNVGYVLKVAVARYSWDPWDNPKPTVYA